MKYVISIVLLVVAAGLGYMVYDSVNSKIEFNKEAEAREWKVAQKLMDIRRAQTSYKAIYGKYADSFDKLIGHVQFDSIPVVLATGSVPDTLSEAQAVELGYVVRDTSLISVRDTLFSAEYNVDSFSFVPFGAGEKFKIDAGEIEKNKMTIQVFEVSASLVQIYTGLDLSNESVKKDKVVKVGSMSEPTTSGNWE